MKPEMRNGPTREELIEALKALEPHFSQIEIQGGRQAVKLAGYVLAKHERRNKDK